MRTRRPSKTKIREVFPAGVTAVVRARFDGFGSAPSERLLRSQGHGIDFVMTREPKQTLVDRPGYLNYALVLAITPPVTLTMPGVVFSECFDRDATGVPVEEGWPEHTDCRRFGRGLRYTFTVTPAQRAEMIAWVTDFAEGQVSGTDPENAARMRKLLAWAEAQR